MRYRQISIEERCEIARLRAEGASVREVARRLDRAASTVTRELRRNASPTGGCRPSVAHDRAWGHRWCGPRLERDEELRADVLRRLVRGCSPEQVAGQLAREEGRTVISYENAYRFVYGQSTRGKDYDWRRYLPRGKWKRGRRRPRTVRPAGIGKRTRCSSADQGRWCGPCTSATRACCSRCGRLRRLRGRLPRPSPGCWDRCRRCFARRCVGALSAGSCSIGVTTTRPALAPSPPSSPERPACRPRPVPALLAAVRASPAQ